MQSDLTSIQHKHEFPTQRTLEWLTYANELDRRKHLRTNAHACRGRWHPYIQTRTKWRIVRMPVFGARTGLGACRIHGLVNIVSASIFDGQFAHLLGKYKYCVSLHTLPCDSASAASEFSELFYLLTRPCIMRYGPGNGISPALKMFLSKRIWSYVWVHSFYIYKHAGSGKYEFSTFVCIPVLWCRANMCSNFGLN